MPDDGGQPLTIVSTNYDTLVESVLFEKLQFDPEAEEDGAIGRSVDPGFSWREHATGKYLEAVHHPPATPRAEDVAIRSILLRAYHGRGKKRRPPRIRVVQRSEDKAMADRYRLLFREVEFELRWLRALRGVAPEAAQALADVVGGLGETGLVARVCWVVRGTDAGSARIRSDTGATEDTASLRPARPGGSAPVSPSPPGRA